MKPRKNDCVFSRGFAVFPADTGNRAAAEATALLGGGLHGNSDGCGPFFFAG